MEERNQAPPLLLSVREVEVFTAYPIPPGDDDDDDSYGDDDDDNDNDGNDDDDDDNDELNGIATKQWLISICIRKHRDPAKKA
jgi:hypothetical protein